MRERLGRRSIAEAAFAEEAAAVTISSAAPAGNVQTEAATVPAAANNDTLRG